MNPVKTIILLVVVALVVFGVYHVIGGGSSEVTGTVNYLDRMALPSGAVVEVRLLDTSMQDVESQTIAEQTITTKGENVPLPFTLTYKASAIDASHTYSVGARILLDGKLAWVSTQAYPVITNGYPSSVDVYVTNVR